jgi:hypothetical protein
MGIDIMLFAVGEVTEAEFVAAVEFFRLRSDSELERRTSYSAPIVECESSQRFYGLNYERGYWPVIYNDIRLMQTAFPNCTIHYDGDYSWYDEISPITEEELAEIWAHWLSSGGVGYCNRAEAWNAKNNPGKDSE